MNKIKAKGEVEMSGYITIRDNIITTSSSNLTGTWTDATEYTTPSGSQFSFKVDKEEPEGNINPALYFRFVKSKFKPIDQQELTLRFDKLQKLVLASKEINQQALYEQLSIQLAVTVREQEALVAGCGIKINTDTVEKFIGKVKDRCIKYTLLENFPRTIPSKVRDKIRTIQDLEIFDSYHVLYTDYTDEALKTNKDKIRERDPILFGSFKFLPKQLYYITDWVDKYCELTMSKLISEIQLDDPEFELDRIPDISDEYVCQILEEVKIRQERLDKTKPSNYKDLMEEEDKDNKKPKKEKKKLSEKISEKLRGR
jgi:hypothetical protein